jgi:hypothetical protein
MNTTARATTAIKAMTTIATSTPRLRGGSTTKCGAITPPCIIGADDGAADAGGGTEAGSWAPDRGVIGIMRGVG